MAYMRVNNYLLQNVFTKLLQKQNSASFLLNIVSIFRQYRNINFDVVISYRNLKSGIEASLAE